MVAFVAAVGFLRFAVNNDADSTAADHPRAATDVSNLAVTIGDRTFTMSHGVGSIAAAPGTDTVNTVRIVGEPVWGDVDRDGQPEAALLLENDPGGTGVFYYAVVAIDGVGGYRATNTLLLGDRIAPQTVDCLDGHFVYNYRSRRPGDPMTARPSVQQNLWIRLDTVSGAISAGRES